MLNRPSFFQILGLSLVCSLMMGCMATSQPTKFYLLNSLSSHELSEDSSRSHLAIGIGPVEIPEYVDRPQIVTRISDHELHLSEFHKWAEPLKDNIPKALAENLSILMATDHISLHPWKRTTPLDYHVAIEISRLDTAPDGKAHLLARWRIFEKNTSRVLRTDKFHFTSPVEGSDYGAVVSAINQTITNLSRAVAKSIRQTASQKGTLEEER